MTVANGSEPKDSAQPTPGKSEATATGSAKTPAVETPGSRIWLRAMQRRQGFSATVPAM